MDIIENFDSNEENQIPMEVEEQVLRVPYDAASESCNTLEASVPIGFASEQAYFNNKLKSIHNVAEYVRIKLKYPSIEALCDAFAKEQIDGIATALHNWETTGKAIIISDQTGLGKGRMIAGLIRYSILTLNKFPVFFTETDNLFSDIYRDLYDIGLEANIPIAVKTKPTLLDRDSITDELVINELKKDIKEGKLRIDYSLPEGVELNEDDIFSEDNSDMLQEIIDLYFDFISENGIVVGDEYTYLAEDLTERQIKNIIKKDIEEFNGIRYGGIELTENQINNLFEPKYEKILNDVIKIYRSNLSIKAKTSESEKEGRIRVFPIAPFKLNIQDKAGNLLYEITANDAKKLINNMQVDSKYQQFGLLCLMYSTIQNGMTDKKTGQKTPKAEFIQKLCNDRMVLLDEAHNAAGSKSAKDKNTGEIKASNRFTNLSFIIRNAKYVTYISATWAKRPDNIPIYALRTAIQDSKLSTQNLITSFFNGGLALQEVVSSALVKDGQLIRREKDVKAEVFIPELKEDDSIALNQISRIEIMAQIWRAMSKVAQDISIEFKKVKIEQFSLDGEGFTEEDIIQIGRENLLKLVRSRYTLGSNLKTQLSRLFEYFLISLKVNQCVNAALEELKQGRKVVIAISNTFNSQYDNIRKNYADNIKYNFGDYIPNDLVEMFKGEVAKLLSFKYNGVRVLDDGSIAPFKTTINLFEERVDDYGKLNFRAIINRFRDFKAELDTLISQLPNIRVPLSPIDVILTKIQSEGYKMDEITGRDRKLVFENNEYMQGIYSKREKMDKMTLVNRFNANELDGLIINVSGATGLSLHALETIVQGKIVPPVNVRTKEVPKSLEPRNEVKARTMIILQMEKDIAKEMQKLGRINRNGQAFIPRYIYINSIIPSEARYNAMAQKKLKSLMSITAGNQDFGKDIFDYDDFLSDYGVLAWQLTVSDLKYDSATFSVSTIDDLKVKSKYLYFLDYNAQKEFYDILKFKLNRIIEEAKAQDSYNVKVDYENYLAITEQVIPYIVSSSETPTIFGSHVFAEVIKVKKLIEINSEFKIKKELTDYYEGFDFLANRRNTLVSHKKEKKREAKEFVSQYVQSQRDGIEQAQEGIDTLQQEIDATNKQLKGMPDIQEIVALELSITNKENEKSELGKKLFELAESGQSTDEVSRQVASLSTEIQSLIKRKEEKSKGQTSKEIEQEKANIERQIRYSLEGIEKRQKLIQNYLSEIAEQEQYLELYNTYIDNIGNIVELEYFESTKTLIGADENGEDIYSYEYVSQSKQQAVIKSIGFSFNYNTYFKLSDILCYLTGATENYSFSLSKAYKKISQSELNKGLRHDLKVTFLNLNYKDNWTKYVETIDPSYYKEEVVLSGDLLKAMAFKSYLNLSGKIVKYTTFDNRLKTSLLLSDESKNNLLKRVEEFQAGSDYPVLFSLSVQNLTQIVSAVVGRAIFRSLAGFRADLSKVIEKAKDGNLNQFSSAMQLFYDRSKVFLIVYPTLSLLEKINDNFISKPIQPSNYAEQEEKDELIKSITKIVFENFDSLRFIMSSESDKIINAFYDIGHNKLGVAQSQENSMYSDAQNVALFYSEDVSQLIPSKSYEAEESQFANNPMMLYKNDFSNIFYFAKDEDGDLNNGVYIIDKTIETQRNIKEENKSDKHYFNMLYNVTFTASAFVTICDYLQRGLNLEMLSTASADTLKYSTIPYVFNLETSSKGLIEQVAIPDNVGDKKIEAIEQIIDDFVKFYLNN